MINRTLSALPDRYYLVLVNAAGFVSFSFGFEHALRALMGSGGYPGIQVEEQIKRRISDGKREEDVRPFYEGLAKGGLTEVQALDALCRQAKLIDTVKTAVIPVSAKPADTYFRNAWIYDEARNVIDVDMVKARLVHMDKLRDMRQAKFTLLGFPVKPHPDVEKLLSEETKKLLKELRDIPENYRLDSAKTPEALKAMIPPQLKDVQA